MTALLGSSDDCLDMYSFVGLEAQKNNVSLQKLVKPVLLGGHLVTFVA